jgi:hypothetical protein
VIVRRIRNVEKGFIGVENQLLKENPEYFQRIRAAQDKMLPEGLSGTLFARDPPLSESACIYFPCG